MTAFSGHIYGVVLNDRDEQADVGASFHAAPYGKPPQAPVIFMKPRVSMQFWPGSADAQGPYRASTSLALLFAEDASAATEDQVARCIGATAIAIDLSLAQPNYYRPAIAFRNAEGTLVLGNWSAPVYPDELYLSVEGQAAHSWHLSRLVRNIPALVAETSQFLTLKAGDVLLVGLPGDAPEVYSGQSVRAHAQGLAAACCIIGGDGS